MKMKIGGALIGVMCLFVVAECRPDTTIVSWRCNGNEYSENDPYADNVEYVLADVVKNTPLAGYSYYSQSPSSTDVAYAHAACNAALSSNDCNDCLTVARSEVEYICASKIGGTVVMRDCAIRYENYPFNE